MAIIKFTNSKSSLARLVSYLIQPSKTEMSLISGKDCVPESSLKEMIASKRMFGKTSGRQYIHLVQSFPKDEQVTHQQAHTIALKVAERFEGFQVLLATHNDRDHVHNHFLINSVNFETGKKWQQSKSEMNDVKDFSDELCQAAGLSIIEHKGNLNMSRGEYKAAEAGDSWKWLLISAVDLALKQSKTKEDFIEHMNLHGYAVNWSESRKYITYTTPDGFKCRDKKLQSPKYTKEEIEHVFSLRSNEVNERPSNTKHGTHLDQRSGSSYGESSDGNTGSHQSCTSNGGQQRICTERSEQTVGSGENSGRSSKRPIRKDDRSR